MAYRHCSVGACMNATAEDRWLCVDEIAAYLGIKRDKVYKWIERKRMPIHDVKRLLQDAKKVRIVAE